MLTKGLSYSFLDRDMFMRHLGRGVGHLQYEWQQEVRPGDNHTDMAVDDASDSSDADLNTGDSEPEIGYDSDEVEEPYNVDYEEGPSDWEGDAIDTSDSDGSDCAIDGYASY